MQDLALKTFQFFLLFFYFYITWSNHELQKNKYLECLICNYLHYRQCTCSYKLGVASPHYVRWGLTIDLYLIIHTTSFIYIFIYIGIYTHQLGSEQLQKYQKVLACYAPPKHCMCIKFLPCSIMWSLVLPCRTQKLTLQILHWHPSYANL